MATLTAKLGSWELPHVHMWKDRQTDIKFEREPLISLKSRIATIGSCFAAELAGAMDRARLSGAMHPTGLFYNTKSIRQEIERIFGGWPAYKQEPVWKVNNGFVHPFKDYRKPFPSEEELRAWSDDLDQRGEALFRSADIIVITLGLIEAWKQPKNGNFYRAIPHPDVFQQVGAQFHRLTVGEMLDDMAAIREVLRSHLKAEIIVTVSPVPLHATMTPFDIRVANTESKSRIRAMVSEFIERYPDIHYFHSYEMVTTAERLSDFMMEDGRHVERHAVDYIIQQFLKQYACDDVAIPEVDTSWLTPPLKTAARVQPKRPPFKERVVTSMMRVLGR